MERIPDNWRWPLLLVCLTATTLGIVIITAPNAVSPWFGWEDVTENGLYTRGLLLTCAGSWFGLHLRRAMKAEQVEERAEDPDDRDRGGQITQPTPPTPPGMRVRTGRFEKLRS